MVSTGQRHGRDERYVAMEVAEGTYRCGEAMASLIMVLSRTGGFFSLARVRSLAQSGSSRG
jgi:hypothetical protein